MTERDFARAHLTNSVAFSEESVLMNAGKIHLRYMLLSKALLFTNTTDSARTAEAGMGRQPKKRIDMSDLYIPFIDDRHTRHNLDHRAELQTLTVKLGVAHIIVEEPKNPRQTAPKTRPH